MKSLSEAKDPDLLASVQAMKRAAELARQVAIQTNTAIAIVEDGKLVHVSAKELVSNNDAVAEAPGQYDVTPKPNT